MKSKKGLTWVISILLVITIVSGGLLIWYVYSLGRARNEFNDLARTFHEYQVEEKVLQKDNPQVQIDKDKLLEEKGKEDSDMTIAFKQLQDQNSDIAGWITIPGTKINYPVMHTPEDPEYYLNRNFEKEYSISGVPFVDGKASMSPRSDNILIHGHNMKNGSMFAQLLLYKDKEFLESHPTIEFYTDVTKQLYDIIAVFPADVANNKIQEFDYHSFINAKDQEAFDGYISSAKQYSLFDTGITADYGDDLLTLSTCSYHTAHGRFVVIARARQEN